MAPSTSAVGPKTGRERVKVVSCGKTDRNMSATGRRIRPTVMVDLSTLMVTSTMDSGSTTKHTDSVYIAILMVPNTRATGKKINNTAMV